MKVIKSLHELGDTTGNGVAVTIGNFDGLHLGHQEMLQTALAECREDGLTLVVLTFTPHPHVVLMARDSFLISSYIDRRTLLEKVGVKVLCEVEFNQQFSRLPPEKFLQDYIFCRDDIRKIILGHDFTFGVDKSGNHELVQAHCKKLGCHFVVLDEYDRQGDKLSSTTIRKHLEQGRVTEANKLLGREFTVSGLVERGESRGNNIGFPTINFRLDPGLLLPRVGVYATSTEHSGVVYRSVTNVGHSPTFGADGALRIETHIIEFNQEIYSDECTVHFIDRIRDEMKFDSVEQLREQIALDIGARDSY